ncbi:MAG: formylglycine-generating enzyme family protein, partial [Acidobacteriota bacterium]|nr:formylglycine-generating enzyme family protein [Acidobacteriota bacterium]
IEQPSPEEPAETSIEISGAVAVEGGETAVGGGISKRPLRREFVKDFLIDETEVTNAQYLKFTQATGYRVPDDWVGGTYPEGKGEYPVVFVSVNDVKRYCKWRSKVLGMEVRLPSYAEWQRAAGGDKRFTYPWGNEWNEAAVISEKKKEASPVRSFELNRSPYGAYDMVGNVWEWTSDILRKNELVSKTSLSGYRPESQIHLVLGGSFNEDRSKLSNSFWAEIDAGTRNKSVGFRCVIIPELK